MRTLQQTFDHIMLIEQMRDESTMGAHQLGAMGITYLKFPCEKHARILAYHLLETLTSEWEDDIYVKWLEDRIESITAILDSDDPFDIKGTIAGANWFYRDAYSNHMWADIMSYDVDFNKVWEALFVYLLIGAL